MKFDPSGPAVGDGIYGLPFNFEESQLILLPVPWEATTSYGGGTSQGPKAIYKASKQVDLFDLDLGHFYEGGIFLQGESKRVKEWNSQRKKLAQKIIAADGNVSKSPALKKALETVNSLSSKVNDYVYSETSKI